MAGDRRPFAADTQVPVSRSIEEIRKLVERFGASAWMSGNNETESMVGFVVDGRQVRLHVPRPNPLSRDITHTAGGSKRTAAQADAELAKAERQRWRALALVVKAMFVAVESGVWSFDEAFLAFVTLPATNQPIGAWLIPQLDDAYETGGTPPLLPGTSPEIGTGNQ